MAKQHGDKKRPRTGAIALGKAPKGARMAHIPCKPGAPGLETKEQKKARKIAARKARKARIAELHPPADQLSSPIRTGSYRDLCDGRFKGEVCLIVARSGVPRSKYQYLLDSGETIEHLARFGPSKSIRDHWKSTHDEIAYREAFIPFIQQKSTTYPSGRLALLRQMIDEFGGSVRLICHEPEGDFCHRHILKELLLL